MTPFPINLAPLGGSRYDHKSTWMVFLKNLRCKNLSPAIQKTRCFWPTKKCSIWCEKLENKYERRWTDKTRSLNFHLQQYILKHIPGIPLLAIRVYPKKTCLLRRVSIPSQKFPRENCLPRHPSATGGFRPTRLLSWAKHMASSQQLLEQVATKTLTWHSVILI